MSHSAEAPLESPCFSFAFFCTFWGGTAACHWKNSPSTRCNGAFSNVLTRKDEAGDKGWDMEAKGAGQPVKICLWRNQWEDVCTTFHPSCNNHTLVAYIGDNNNILSFYSSLYHRGSGTIREGLCARGSTAAALWDSELSAGASCFLPPPASPPNFASHPPVSPLY